jgi:hypothetical protein
MAWATDITMLVALGWLSACGDNLPDLAHHDEIFASTEDHGVLCAANADSDAYTFDAIEAAMDRARDEQRIVQLFMHEPRHTISEVKVEDVLAAADARGLAWVTSRELAQGRVDGPGIALGFDDWWIDEWFEQRDVFAAFGAHVTFFVSDYDAMDAEQRAHLATLASDGNDVEYHSTHHWDAPAYVAAHGLAAYLADDIDPALEALRVDGYDPIVFAYPLGRRTRELDTALLERFAAVRATTRQCPRGHE